jgi:hypothetical protein
MNSERRMTSRTRLPLAITIVTLFVSPALAQSSVGGPTKPANHVGGATTHPNPVVPPPKGATSSTTTKTPSNPTSTSTRKK